ncbi:MAG: hypothetical protein MUE70_10595 [Desulfobacterales bacterium]|jgi:hypothetical protein|nr:hypothetical protein [Desulfobacterales bacterium]
MVKEKFEITFVFIDKDDDVFIFRLLDERCSECGDFNAGKQEIKEKPEQKTPAGGEIAGEMVVNPDKFSADPFCKFSFYGYLHLFQSLSR